MSKTQLTTFGLRLLSYLDELKGRRSIETGNFQTLIKLRRTKMKFSNLAELITVNKPTDEFYL